ncbi:MAG: LamG-like jellyroll fold domain-containing protein [Saprospiraceae bacterium]
MKHFYKHRSTRLVRSEMDYDSIPNFPLKPKSTLELWFSSNGPDGIQCLLSKRWDSWDFRLMLDETNLLKCYLNGIEEAVGQIGVGFQHLAFTIDSTGSGTVLNFFLNGSPFGSQIDLPSYTGNWSDDDQAWVLGARPSGMGPMNNNVGTIDNFGGLMDEFAVYDTIWPLADIQYHATHSRDMKEAGLQVYFALDEGSGNVLYNSGSLFLPTGSVKGAEWSPLAANQSSTPHVFAPSTRQVTLNPSITSVDQVDFTDRSTIPVTGYVRFANTECFAKGVEILVNGASYNPIIRTDSTGKFTVELDPGTTAKLTPKYEDHQFVPSDWEVVNVTSPRAGLLFNDITTRTISGQIAGGHCKKPIITLDPPQFASDCRVTVSTKDKCYERTIPVDNIDGFFEFDDLPPLEMTLAITKHNNPLVYEDFQAQGGKTIDLAKDDSLGVEFIYISEPQLEVEGFDMFTKTDCPGEPIVIDQNVVVMLTVKVYEQYGSSQDPADRCYLDSALLSINNTFDHNYDFTTTLDTFYKGGEFQYLFVADNPNEFAPYEQIIEITADDDGRLSQPYTNKAIITGTIVGEAKFTTQLPLVPVFILRDPPGDGSSSFLEKENKSCNSLSMENGGGGGPYFASKVSTGFNVSLTIPLIGTEIASEAVVGPENELTTSFTYTDKNSLEFCVTNNERIATDDSDLIVGGATLLDNTSNDTLAGNDVYVGIGFNVIFSDSKEVTFDDMACSVNVDNVVTASPDTFVTNYKYSEWNIENHVIRYLDTLIQNGIDQDNINTKSKAAWLNYIKLNKQLKESAVYEQNISFDAGVEYSSSITLDTTTTWEGTSEQNIEATIGLFIEAGVTKPVEFTDEAHIGIKASSSNSQGNGTSNSNSITTGFTLKDDDPGDNFTIDIKKDQMYQTPVFEVVAGQSSCPWEVGTAHREGVSMIPKDGTKRTNVRSNEAAVFHFDLGNNSSTYEDFSYTLVAGPESNPDGAVIKVNGAILDHNLTYAIAYGTTLPITISVERGPQEYSYHGLEVVLFSACHDERCGALGFAPDFETFLYSANYLDVDFIKPCSEVEITGPLQGWVVKPDEVNPANRTSCQLPFRVMTSPIMISRPYVVPVPAVPGDGAWINIGDDIPKSALGPVFYTRIWDTGGSPALADGNYELRAVSVCSGGGDKNGYSHYIQGRIDRLPPSLIGTPEPSDGVYNVGDEISFTFNKEINCSKLQQAQALKVMLFDATTNLPIDIDVTCYENKVILDPNFQNEYFENRILRAELHDIEDLTGNNLVYEQWEFYVDRNELGWLTDSLGITKFEDETITVSAGIHNRGGYPVPFTIEDIPEWVHVVPNQGTLAPNEIRAIQFTVDTSLAFGLWTDSITLHTVTGQNPFFMGGDEGLPLGVRVVCRPPTWFLDPIAFENSENMVLELVINGQVSTDVEDMVVAYMGDTLVGRANVQYVPQLDKYLAYLTVYGYSSQVLSPIRLEIWDASACLRYAVTEDNFVYEPDIVIGDPINPQQLHAENNVLRDVPLGDGWNWMSFNLAFPDPSLNEALSSLQHPENDLMTGQNAFAVYLNGTGWIGSLNALDNLSMYIYRGDQADTLKMLGAGESDPATTPILWLPAGTGSAIYPASLFVGEWSTFFPVTANGRSDQESVFFAQYINSDFGWIGNLKFMQPPWAIS